MSAQRPLRARLARAVQRHEGEGYVVDLLRDAQAEIERLRKALDSATKGDAVARSGGSPADERPRATELVRAIVNAVIDAPTAAQADNVVADLLAKHDAACHQLCTALRQYGRHTNICERKMRSDRACTCGFSAALLAAEAPPKEPTP